MDTTQQLSVSTKKSSPGIPTPKRSRNKSTKVARVEQAANKGLTQSTSQAGQVSTPKRSSARKGVAPAKDHGTSTSKTSTLDQPSRSSGLPVVLSVPKRRSVGVKSHQKSQNKIAEQQGLCEPTSECPTRNPDEGIRAVVRRVPRKTAQKQNLSPLRK